MSLLRRQYRQRHKLAKRRHFLWRRRIAKFFYFR